MTQQIRVYHTGRIAHESPIKPGHPFPHGMIWSRDMRFFFTHVPAGEYTLEVLMKEATRIDAGATEEQPAVNIYLGNRLVVERAGVKAERADDPYAVVPIPVTVTGQGFDLRIYGIQGGLTLPCLYGMRLCQGEDTVYAFTVGDARERAMWSPSELSMEDGATTCRAYEALLHSGVPLGGIGTGRVELLTNGTLGYYSCANNWDVPTAWTEGSFFALWTNTDGAVLLHPPRTAGGYGLPTAEALYYRGRYPVAEVEYALGPNPLALRLRAQGTIVPGREDLSTLPAATFTFTVTNTSDKPVETALLMSQENLAGQGGYYYVKHDWSANLRDRYESVNGACQRAQDGMGFAGVRQVCDRVPEATGEANSMTQYLIAAEGDGISRCLGWNIDAAQPAFWEQFAASGTLPLGDNVPGQDGVYRPGSAVAKKLTLAPGDTAEVVFVLAWQHNGHTTFRDEVNHGHAYQTRYPDVSTIAQAALAGRTERAALIEQFQAMLADSTLPAWLQTKLINGAFPTTTNTVWTADDFFSVHESPNDMAGAVGTLDQRMAAHPFTFAFFPTLDRLELDWFRRCQLADGQLPHMIGNVYDKLGSTETFFCITGWPDLSCSFIFQTYRHFLYTGDRAWLETCFAAYGKAIDWMLSTDQFGLGLPVGGHTYDYDAADWTEGAPMIFNAVNFLGALRAAMDAARRLGRSEELTQWQAAFDKAYASLMTHFWNGKFFRKWVHPASGNANDNCFVAQLAGDWFVRVLGLEPIFPDEISTSILRNIVELNMLPHYPAIVMEATPTGEVVTQGGYIQQHEPYLGMNLIYHGQVQRGLDVLRRRQEITWHVNSNPWGESLATQTPSGRETALHDYMTSPAGWNVLYALTGCTVDAEAQTLRFAPQMDGQRRLRLPVFLQDLWLMLDIDLDRADPARLEVLHRGPLAVALTEAQVTLPLVGTCTVAFTAYTSAS